MFLLPFCGIYCTSHESFQNGEMFVSNRISFRINKWIITDIAYWMRVLTDNSFLQNYWFYLAHEKCYISTALINSSPHGQKWPPFRRRYRQMHFHGLRCNMFLRLWLYKYSYGEQLCLWHVRAVVIFGARFYCLLWSAARIRPGKFRLWRLHTICLLLYTCNVYYMYEKCVVDCVYWLGVQWKFV